MNTPEWDEEQQPVAHRKKHKKKRRFRLSVAMFKRRYIFTDNVHPRKGIFSFFLGVIAAVTLVLCVRAAFNAGGIAPAKYGVAALLAFGYSIAGLVFGILAGKQKKIFRLFPNMGIGLCTINIVCVVVLVIAGILL